MASYRGRLDRPRYTPAYNDDSGTYDEKADCMSPMALPLWREQVSAEQVMG